MNKWIVAYDIPDDRRRRKVADALENFGDRVQYSVFEVLTRDTEIDIVTARIRRIIDSKEDSVRLYPLCETCAAKVIVVGIGRDEPWENPDVYIV
ncbi:MAG: CRISPR-associated endonuclease Cas2 [Pseudomonadota bacterium]